MENKFQEWLTLAARVASLTIVPLGVWMVNGLEENSRQIDLIQQKMDLRTQARDQQMALLNNLLSDHETRLRVLEKENGK